MILVTGAAGFIGSNILADLELAGMGPVAACDWFEDGDKWRNVAKREIMSFVRPENLFDWLEARSDVKAIIHMGAISATTERDADLLIERNINTTVKLWDYCCDREIPFIYASSAATYGSMERDLFDHQEPDFLAGLRPLNGYGWSKNATDRILMRRVQNGEKTPPQWAGLKFFNVYGPNEYHKGSMMSVVAKFFEPVSKGEVVKLFKSDRPEIEHGQQMRDFVYVKDCTKTIIWLLQNPEVSGIFNIGTGEARSFKDLIGAIGLALNVDVEIEYVDLPDQLKGKYQYFTQAEMNKLESKGFDTNFDPMEESVRDYVINYLNREDPFR